jgi:hypothetical protein
MTDSGWSFFAPVDRRRQALLYVADMKALPRYDLNLKAAGGLLTWPLSKAFQPRPFGAPSGQSRQQLLFG